MVVADAGLLQGLGQRKAQARILLWASYGLVLFLFVPLDVSMSYGAPDLLEVSGCPLNREVMDLFRILVDSTLTFKISANGCNLTGTLADPSSFRQGNCRSRLATDWMNEDADRER